MFNEKENKDPQGFGADAKASLNLGILGAAALAEPCLATRPSRGSRCSPPLVKLLAPVAWLTLWAAGGGGSVLLMYAVVGTLFLLSFKKGEKYCERHGLPAHSRAVGGPPHCGPRLPYQMDYIVELVVFWAVAGAFLAFGQPGLALCFFVGSLAALVEMGLVERKNKVLDRDVADAMAEQREAARRRGW